ncbi:histone H2A-Bbd type 2/3 [Theropithecus gelada]|uniref:histone H2A-Bbd type 2/3 n=1 Tax=Theropithecus gelada TaxID=9565 RepID=UPI00027F6D1C|nr:histone H2A-Bbd type 2/3 [Theropithecus gelada]
MSGRRSHRRSSGAGGRGQTRSRTVRAELSFSVSQVERGLREGHYAQRLSPTAPVYLAAVIEYLTAKVLELAGNEAQDNGERTITPLLLDRAVHNNRLLSTLFDTTIISQVAPGGD